MPLTLTEEATVRTYCKLERGHRLGVNLTASPLHECSFFFFFKRRPRDRPQRALGEAFGLLVLNLPLFPLFSLSIAMALAVQILPLTTGSAGPHE